MSTSFGDKRSFHNEPSSSATRFYISEELLRTRIEIPLLRELDASPVRRVACRKREPSTVATLLHAASTVSNPRMEMSVYISCFRYWIDGCRSLSIALKGGCPYVIIRIFALRHACWCLSPSNCYVGPIQLEVELCNFFLYWRTRRISVVVRSFHTSRVWLISCVFAKGDLEATESHSDFHSLEPPRFAIAPQSVSDWAFSAVLKRVKRTGATNKLSCTRKKLARVVFKSSTQFLISRPAWLVLPLYHRAGHIWSVHLTVRVVFVALCFMPFVRAI